MSTRWCDLSSSQNIMFGHIWLKPRHWVFWKDQNMNIQKFSHFQTCLENSHWCKLTGIQFVPLFLIGFWGRGDAGNALRSCLFPWRARWCVSQTTVTWFFLFSSFSIHFPFQSHIPLVFFMLSLLCACLPFPFYVPTFESLMANRRETDIRSFL